MQYDDENHVIPYTPKGYGDGVIPKHLISLYTRKENNDVIYAEIATLRKNGYGANRPLKRSTMSSLVKDFAPIVKEKRKDFHLEGIVPSRLIYVNKDKVVWQQYPTKTGIRIYDSLIELTTPHMLFVRNPNSLRALCMAEPFNGNPDTTLYRAPFPNCYTDGSICTGNASIGKSLEAKKVMEEAERFFWGSTFTHMTNENIKGNPIEVYKRAKKSFPVDALIKTNHKVLDL